ncbi:MAG TPA: tetratricopeptide repeat protein [Thermoanaerobaculia bacterium]|nr:tetratricopeptide repeat protein [Thermoanaerobaculia bacterium]
MTRSRGGIRLLPWLAAAGAAVGLVLQTDRALDRIGASKRLRVVEVMSERMARTGQAPRELVSGHFRLLRQARRLDPSEVGVLVALGGQYLLLGQPEPAITTYGEALALEPRPETYLNLGLALLETGRLEEARAAFETAVRLAPRLASRVPPGMGPKVRR